MADAEHPWEPSPIEAERFHAEAPVNINRAPPDRAGGVLYKRNALIKRVRYTPFEAAEEGERAGHGETIVRWLLSEAPGSAEGNLAGARFHRLLDLELAAGASTGESAKPVIRILYVIAGQGRGYTRPHAGAPYLARPRRPGDLMVIPAGVRHTIAQDLGDAPLRLLLLELEPPCP